MNATAPVPLFGVGGDVSMMGGNGVLLVDGGHENIKLILCHPNEPLKGTSVRADDHLQAIHRAVFVVGVGRDFGV